MGALLIPVESAINSMPYLRRELFRLLEENEVDYMIIGVSNYLIKEITLFGASLHASRFSQAPPLSEE